MTEVWKDIIGYEGLYQVSNLGRVKSLKHSEEWFLKYRLNKKGYASVVLFKGTVSSKKQFMVHRLVADAFIPNPENKPQINHKDGNKLNNSVENLEWVTNYENCIHAHANALVATPNPHKGEEAYQHKLTWKDVECIRERYAEGTTSTYELAKEFNVTPSCIGLIVRNKRWVV